MLEIAKEINGNSILLILKGRLDTNTAYDLQKTVSDSIENVNELVINVKDLEYMSSAGLRLLLIFHKTIDARGGIFIVKYPNEDIYSILDMTGFTSFLNIER